MKCGRRWRNKAAQIRGMRFMRLWADPNIPTGMNRFRNRSKSKKRAGDFPRPVFFQQRDRADSILPLESVFLQLHHQGGLHRYCLQTARQSERRIGTPDRVFNILNGNPCKGRDYGRKEGSVTLDLGKKKKMTLKYRHSRKGVNTNGAGLLILKSIQRHQHQKIFLFFRKNRWQPIDFCP